MITKVKSDRLKSGEHVETKFPVPLFLITNWAFGVCRNAFVHNLTEDVAMSVKTATSPNNLVNVSEKCTRCPSETLVTILGGGGLKKTTKLSVP